MTKLLELATPDIAAKPDAEVYRFITRLLGTEISNMVKPCYIPKFTKYYLDLQKLTGITDDVIKEFKRNVESQYLKFNIYADKYTILLLMAVIYYIRKNKADISNTFFKLLAIKFYSSRIHIHFSKFCNEDLWIVTLDKLSPKHLFRVQNGITNAMMYISDFDFEKEKIVLKSNSLSNKDLVRIVYGLRTKIAQSVRSFAELYYSIYEESKKQKADVDDGLYGVQLVADKISMTICTYGQIDKEALTTAIVQSRIRKDLAIASISQISVPEYKDKLRFIILLIGRIFNIKDVCIESKRNKLIRSINSDKLIAGKYSLKDEIKKTLYSLESGYQLKTIYETQLVMFFATYISIFLRNRIC